MNTIRTRHKNSQEGVYWNDDCVDYDVRILL